MLATIYCGTDKETEAEWLLLPSLLHVVQTGPRDHLASYPVGTLGKAAGV
jgi:hypothetical protein